MRIFQHHAVNDFISWQHQPRTGMNSVLFDLMGLDFQIIHFNPPNNHNASQPELMGFLLLSQSLPASWSEDGASYWNWPLYRLIYGRQICVNRYKYSFPKTETLDWLCILINNKWMCKTSIQPENKTPLSHLPANEAPLKQMLFGQFPNATQSIKTPLDEELQIFSVHIMHQNHVTFTAHRVQLGCESAQYCTYVLKYKYFLLLFTRRCTFYLTEPREIAYKSNEWFSHIYNNIQSKRGYKFLNR